jgi:hypothetical protein
MTNTTSIAYQLIHHGTTRTSAWNPLVTQRTCTGNRQQDLQTFRKRDGNLFIGLYFRIYG